MVKQWLHQQRICQGTAMKASSICDKERFRKHLKCSISPVKRPEMLNALREKVGFHFTRTVESTTILPVARQFRFWNRLQAFSIFEAEEGGQFIWTYVIKPL